MNAPLVSVPVIIPGDQVLAPAETWTAASHSDRATPVLDAGPAAEPLGSQARRLFHALKLYDRPRHPRTPLLHVPVVRQAALLGHGLYCVAKLGGAVAERVGKSRLQQLREIAGLAWRQGLDAQTYYMQELYRAGGRQRAAETLTRFETKNGLLSALKLLQPRSDAKRSPLGDKLAFHARCRRHGIDTVPILLSAVRGQYDVVDGDFAEGEDLFMKPRHGKGARGAALLRHLGQTHYRTDDGRILSQSALLADLARRSLETPYLLQPRLTNHRDIADLAGESLLVVRVITCLDDAGRPVITHSMLRVIGKLEPGWDDATEYAAPIDLATGRMGAMTGDKLGAALDWHDRHPVTQTPVAGRILAAWPEVRQAALRAHRAFADRVLLGWDIAVTPQGVVVIEGNALPDVAFLQRVHRQPIGQSLLAPLLRGHLGRLEAASS
nr:sugar-transfer associated ATP-grasp domain-containing protein [uncultured Dongia sp.]